jgi:hypothetical protein
MAMNFKSSINTLLFVLTTLFLWVSCGTKEKYEKLENTLTEIEKRVENLTPEDWDKYDQEIEQVKKQLKEDRDSYTPEEAEKMNKLIGKYYALKANHKVSNLKQDLQDATQQLKGAYEVLFQ